MTNLDILLRLAFFAICLSGTIYFIYGIYVIYQSHTKERQLQIRIKNAMNKLDTLLENERQKPAEPDHR